MNGVIDFNADFFALFQQPRTFRQDPSVLDKRYRDIQAKIHPDKFVGSGETERRVSMQWATRVNEGYQTLKKPLARAQYLLALAGHDVAAENNNAMPPEFLMEQMEWREAVVEARAGANRDDLDELRRRVKNRMNWRYEQLAEFIDDKADYQLAADRVRRLMFLEKLLFEIDEAIAALDD